MTEHVSKQALQATLPPPGTDDLRSRIRAHISLPTARKLIVLDDDPTGTQTVRDIPVLTTWEVETLVRELASPHACFYLLTNSRSLPPTQAEVLIREIARNLREAVWRAAGFAEEPPEPRAFCLAAIAIVLRSDSTLRGHFPLESDILSEELGPFDATILFPYFEAGGRWTVNDIHYASNGDDLVPAAETLFARDAAFGYHSSHLGDYVEEKTHGRVRAQDVISFSIEELRPSATHKEPGVELTRRLRALHSGRTAIVNAIAPSDAESFAEATLRAESAGGRYLFRTAAQFIAARLGLEPQALWQSPMTEEYPERLSQGGLIIVGSYVSKTTDQLAHLQASGKAEIHTLEVEALLSRDAHETVLDATACELEAAYSRGVDVVLVTSRRLIAGTDPTTSLEIGNQVSKALVHILQKLRKPPRFLMAKGGITASDLATRGLGVRRAIVRGQLLPGVPVWELGEETKFPGMPYIIFPGNVGGPSALTDALHRLSPIDHLRQHS